MAVFVPVCNARFHAHACDLTSRRRHHSDGDVTTASAATLKSAAAGRRRTGVVVAAVAAPTAAAGWGVTSPVAVRSSPWAQPVVTTLPRPSRAPRASARPVDRNPTAASEEVHVRSPGGSSAAATGPENRYVAAYRCACTGHLVLNLEIQKTKKKVSSLQHRTTIGLEA